jgi:RecA-family ATPase
MSIGRHIDGTPIEPQAWIVRDWVPRLETIGLGSGGGEDKTLLMQMLATAGALQAPWLKIELPMFKSFLVLCEDRLGDVRRRQAKINQHYDCREADLRDNMRVWPRRSSEHNYLMWFDRDGIGHKTSFFDQLLGEIKAFHADLVVLDTKADLFFGNQNNEQQARTFVGTVNLWHRLASAHQDG